MMSDESARELYIKMAEVEAFKASRSLRDTVGKVSKVSHTFTGL